MENKYTNAPTNGFYRWMFFTSCILICLFNLPGKLNAQILIGPSNGGDFSLGNTFAANNWTVGNSVNNPWFLGNTVPAVSPMAGNYAYISNDGGATRNYTNTALATNYFYRDVTVPASATGLSLSFNWTCSGESTWDMWQVFYGSTSLTPLGTATHPGSGTNNVPAEIAGATFVGNGNLQTTVQTFNGTLPGSLAGTTFRLFFVWKDDGSGGTHREQELITLFLRQFRHVQLLYLLHSQPIWL